jgi:prepilin-type N-terminal cleavage/methylation domain-containing protein
MRSRVVAAGRTIMTVKAGHRSHLTATGQRHEGYTLIELVVSLLITAIILAIATPTFLSVTKAANDTAAQSDLQLELTAQNVYRRANPNQAYAPDLHVLGAAGLIDKALATGRAHGYAFYLTTSPDGQHFTAVAAPAAVNRSGNYVFTVDETGVVLTECPPGQHVDPASGKCVPNDTFLRDTAVRAIQAIDRLSGGLALPAARRAAMEIPMLAQDLMRLVLDTNHDGMLTIDELLNPNALGPTLRPVLRPITDAVRRDLAVGVANEEVLPVPISAMTGDLAGFLNSIPASTAPAGAR